MAVSLCTMIAAPEAFAAEAAQKIGLIDVNRVYQQMPEKKSADQGMQAVGNKAASDIKKLQAEFNAYQSQKAKTRKGDPVKEKSFQTREQAIRAEVAKKEQELYGPVQQKLKTAIDAVAKKDGYSIVIDKNATVFNDAAFELTFKVLDQLNIK